MLASITESFESIGVISSPREAIILWNLLICPALAGCTIASAWVSALICRSKLAVSLNISMAQRWWESWDDERAISALASRTTILANLLPILLSNY